jgi:hypothetical protein
MVGGSPASSTTKTGRYDIAEILLKVALNTLTTYLKTISDCVKSSFIKAGFRGRWCFVLDLIAIIRHIEV